MAEKKKIITTGIIACAVAIGAAAYFLMPETVSVYTVERIDVSQNVKVTGNITSDDPITLYAPVSGRISHVYVKPGEVLSGSDVVASYDVTLIENDYARSKASLSAAQQSYEAAVTENNTARAKYDTAKSAEAQNRQDLENTLSMVNALDIANRASYLSPEDYSEALDLESRMKYLEQDSQIKISDKAAAQARLAELETYEDAYDAAKKIVKSAEKSLDKAIEEGKPEEEIAALQAAVTAAEIEKDAAKSAYNSVKDILEDTKDEVNSAQNALDANSQSLSASLTRLDEINKRNYSKTMSDAEYSQYTALESRISLLEQDLAKNISDRQYNESKLINQHTIEQYQDTVDIVRADVDSAEYLLSLATDGIKSETSGVTLERYIDDNAMVEAGTPICRIQPVENIKVEVMISKFDIDKIAIDQEADITVGESAYTGRVTRIIPVAEKDSSGKPKVKVWVEVDVSETIPTIGLEANVVIHTGEDAQALSVPFECVYSDEDGDYVYILEGSEASKRYIETGLKGNDRYSVTSGISQGDRIITTPFSDAQLTGKYKPTGE